MALRTNLNAMFNVTHPLIDAMIEKGRRRIINIASINGSKGQFDQTNYTAAKAGIHGFTKSLDLKVARKGIAINTISPGYMDTAMVAAVPRDVLKTQIVANIPVGQLRHSYEIGALVAFVCSEKAAFTTGSNLAMHDSQHMA